MNLLEKDIEDAYKRLQILSKNNKKILILDEKISAIQEQFNYYLKNSNIINDYKVDFIFKKLDELIFSLNALENIA